MSVEWNLWKHYQCNYTAGSEVFHPDGAQTRLLSTQSTRVLPLTQILRMTHMEGISLRPAKSFSFIIPKYIQRHALSQFPSLWWCLNKQTTAAMKSFKMLKVLHSILFAVFGCLYCCCDHVFMQASNEITAHILQISGFFWQIEMSFWVTLKSKRSHLNSVVPLTHMMLKVF